MHGGPDPSASPAFLAGGGEMGALMRAHDWSATSLGLPDAWPQPLKTLVGVMLGSRQPMFVAWGPERRILYNDGYAELCRDRHPAALGRRFAEVWWDIIEDIGPILERALAGEATHMDDIALEIEREGRRQEAHFGFSYTPVRGEDGAVAGMFCACTETTEQVLMRRQAAEDARRQLRIFEQAPSFMGVVTGPDHVYAFANAAYLRTSGKAELVGKSVREALPELEGQGIFELLDRVYATGERFVAKEIELVLRNGADGSLKRRYLDFIYEPITDETHRVTGIFVEGYDVTEARLAREALRQAGERQAVLIQLDDRFRGLDRPADLSYASAEIIGEALGACRVGYGLIDAAAGTIAIERDWTAPGVQSVAGLHRFRDYGTYFAELSRGEPVAISDVETDRHTADDPSALLGFGIRALLDVPLTEQGTSVAQIFVHSPRPRTWSAEEIALVRDVALRTRAAVARRAAEQELRDLNADLERQVIERTQARGRTWQVSPDLMGALNAQGYFETSNPAWRALLGWSEEDVAGMSIWELLHPDDVERTRAGFALTQQGQPALRFPNRYRCKDGSYRWISWVGVPEDGMVYCTGRDITVETEQAEALRQAEDQLRHAQKMEAVGQLTGGVAHDFNNLLTIIKTSTDLLRRPDLAAERRRRYVDAISDTVDRAAKLTGQLLAFARRQSLKPEVFDVAERLYGVVDMLGAVAGSGVQIVADLDAASCCVEADVGQFETALVNMAVNARDAMNGQGTIRVRVEPVSEMPAIRGHGVGAGRFVAVSLSDTGSGIPADQLTLIFDPFYTTKEVGKGTGLGLSQVFGFAKQSGGDVAVASEIGRGATFTLYLPRVDRSEAAVDAGDVERPEQDDTGGGRRLLVVEDNLEVGTFSTHLLQDLGYETTWAANADEALRLLDQANGFDAVFSDVVMPGMSGVELAQEIRRRQPDLPVVLTSGYSPVLVENGHQGFEVLQKPYAIEELSSVLRRALRPR